MSGALGATPYSASAGKGIATAGSGVMTHSRCSEAYDITARAKHPDSGLSDLPARADQIFFSFLLLGIGASHPAEASLNEISCA